LKEARPCARHWRRLSLTPGETSPDADQGRVGAVKINLRLTGRTRGSQRLARGGERALLVSRTLDTGQLAARMRRKVRRTPHATHLQ